MEDLKALVRKVRRVTRTLAFAGIVVNVTLIGIAVVSLATGNWGAAFWFCTALVMMWTTEMRVNMADKNGFSDGALMVVENVYPNLSGTDEAKALWLLGIYGEVKERPSLLKRLMAFDKPQTTPSGPPDIESIP